LRRGRERQRQRGNREGGGKERNRLVSFSGTLIVKDLPMFKCVICMNAW
jgi:hypothetical protein